MFPSQFLGMTAPCEPSWTKTFPELSATTTKSQTFPLKRQCHPASDKTTCWQVFCLELHRVAISLRHLDWKDLSKCVCVYVCVSQRGVGFGGQSNWRESSVVFIVVLFNPPVLLWLEFKINSRAGGGATPRCDRFFLYLLSDVSFERLSNGGEER